MTLKDRIDEYKRESAGKASDEMVRIMGAAKDAVQDSIAGRKIPTVGDSFPEFSMLDSNGSSVSSTELLERGPLVVSFFRGMW